MKIITILSKSFLAIVLINSAKADFSDTLFSKQWALKNNGQTIYLQDSDLTRQKVVGIPNLDLNFLDTANMPSTKNEIIVAVLDSGIDLTHPDLQGKIWYNQKLCANVPNAKNLPCNGFNFLDNNTSLLDDVGHGTHVAGVVAANRNNIGIVGSGDPRIKIMPLKVLNNSVSGFVYNGKLITDVIADAMIFAIKNGAEVINLSLGWPKLIDTPKVRAAFQMAEDQNVMVIAAAGNNNKDLPTFPCSYESVVCVAAHDNRGQLTDFTNHGAKVDVVAPGEYIVSTYPTNLESRVLRIKNYEVKRGSSQAAPFVTASVATLKLLRPGLKNDEVRSLLFRSVKPLNEKSKRFIKFGMLDQKRLIEISNEESKTFLNPQIKNLTEVKFKISDKKFSFVIPFKNISSVTYSGRVCLKNTSEAVSLDNECFDIANLNSGAVVNFNVTGTLLDLNADSQIQFNLLVDDKSFSLPIFFTRDLNNDASLISKPIVGGNFDEMAVISSGRRISKMMRVIDKLQQLNSPEYFFQEKVKQTEAQTVVSLLTNDNGNWVVKNINLAKVNKVLSIHRQDINLDGKLDYMVYALSSDKLNLKLFFFDQNLNPLFGKNSEWNWALTTFEGLPIDGGLEKFDWVKIKSDNLGNILVPSITRIYDMPEEDNSKNILERVVSKSLHQYYLNPTSTDKGIQVSLRVLDSVSTMKKLKSSLGLDSTYQVELVKTLPLDISNYKIGILKLLVRVSNNEETKYFEVKFNSNIFELTEIKSSLPLDGSAIYSVYNLDSKQTSSEFIFSNLLNRSRANFVIKNDLEVDYATDLINGWENPILSLIGAYSIGGNHTFMMENRYTVSFSDQNGTFKYELPVYRDSSFPGQNFSETLNSIVSNGRPGVYVNSTLIFGERLYSMIGTENGLVRPLSLSVSIPDACIPLAPEFVDSKESSQFVFLCVDSTKQLSLKLLPMSQN